MKDSLDIQGKKYISAKRVKQLFGYSSDYVGQLCRAEKLDCKMVGRSWFVNEDSIIEYKSSISEQVKEKNNEKRKKIKSDLNKFSNLNFQSHSNNNHTQFKNNNQGQIIFLLQSGSNVDVLSENILDENKSNQNINENILIKENVIAELCSNESEKDNIDEFNSIKINNIDDVNTVDEYEEKLFFGDIVATKKVSYTNNLFPIAVFILIITFVFGFSMNPNKYFKMAGNTFSNIMNEIGYSISNTYSELANNFDNAFLNVIDIDNSVATANKAIDFISDIYSDIGFSIVKGFRRTSNTLADIIYNNFLFVNPSHTVLVKDITHNEKINLPVTKSKNKIEFNGIAVVPSKNSDDQDEIIKQKIKDSFSDEVKVKPDKSGTSGVITPVFKKAEGDDFVYVLVPIKN